MHTKTLLALLLALPVSAHAGTLLGSTRAGTIELPVLALEVRLDVTGTMVRGTVVESFSNTTGSTIDATYVLPLPERAAVDSMELRVGDRRIVAVVKEKEAARRAFEAARAEGRKAALVAEQRPNLFTTAVANVNCGETVRVHVDFVEELAPRDGAFELSFPLTYTPRYSSAEETASPQAFTIAGPAAPRATVTVTLADGLRLTGIASPSHDVTVRHAGHATIVEPAAGPVLADRDFVLRWSPERGATAAGTIFVEDREDGRYALLMLVPPAVAESRPAFPTDTLFIIDTSGSMQGPSISEAQSALHAAIDRLRPQDDFGVLAFDSVVRTWQDELRPATITGREDARAFVTSLVADRGTEILAALERGMAMMAARRDTARPGRIVLITDGAVSDEEACFRAVSSKLGDVRLHVLGIGSAPNRHLMRKLAQFGRGSAEFITTPDEVGPQMEGFLARLERPVLTDLALDWNGAPPLESFPQRLPDLYEGEPLFVSVKLGHGHPGTRAVLSGRAVDAPWRTELAVAPQAPQGSGIATRWARAKVDALYDRLEEGADADATRAEGLAVATAFHLVTRWTSLVAVEEFVSADGAGERVDVPNALPAGSHLLDAALPAGGSDDPLLRRIGGVLGLLGVALAFAAWRVRT